MGEQKKKPTNILSTHARSLTRCVNMFSFNGRNDYIAVGAAQWKIRMFHL